VHGAALGVDDLSHATNATNSASPSNVKRTIERFVMGFPLLGTVSRKHHIMAR
jgi:hypothetical protein